MTTAAAMKELVIESEFGGPRNRTDATIEIPAVQAEVDRRIHVVRGELTRLRRVVVALTLVLSAALIAVTVAGAAALRDRVTHEDLAGSHDRRLENIERAVLDLAPR